MVLSLLMGVQALMPLQEKCEKLLTFVLLSCNLRRTLFYVSFWPLNTDNHLICTKVSDSMHTRPLPLFFHCLVVVLRLEIVVNLLDLKGHSFLFYCLFTFN